MIIPLFLGTTELLLIGGLALLLFGGKKLPEMMRGLGQGVKEFKKGMNENQNVEKENVENNFSEEVGFKKDEKDRKSKNEVR